MSHRFTCRVYYEDTDLAGIVYYANYLKFIERGRTEYVRSLGLDQARLKDEEGLVFAVRRLEADYLRPAKFDDMLTILTQPRAIGGARIVLRQDVLRESECVFTADVTLVLLTASGRPTRLPADLAKALQRHDMSSLS